MKIVIIEDDYNMVDFLATSLQIGWPEAVISSTDKGADGIDLVANESPDIILLDLGLPDINGFEVLRRIRLTSDVPIIIITVNDEEKSVVKGLTLGADDYISKPIRPLEMMARMKNCLNKIDRCKEQDLNLCHGSLHFGQSMHELYKGKQKIELTEIESRIMYLLLRNAGRIVTYNQLANEVFGSDYLYVKDSVKTHVNHLRKKLEDDPCKPCLILNRRSIGYQLL